MAIEYKVLLIPDVSGWAWWNRCKGIQKFHSYDNVQVDVECQGNCDQKLLNKYDAVLVMSWPDAPRWTHPNLWTFVANEGTCHPYPADPNGPQNMRTASRSKNITTAQRVLPRYAGVININPKVQSLLERIHHNVCHLMTGVDTEFWNTLYPAQRELPITIGWSGKSFDSPELWTPKGHNEVLKPVMVECRKRFGKDVFFEVNRSAHANRLRAGQQREFYNGCDVFLVTSCSEGTPSVLMEAMSCGRAAISTDVGIAKSVEDFILANGCPGNERPLRVVDGWNDRDSAAKVVSQIVEQIELIVSNAEHIPLMGEVARMEMDLAWSWKALADLWVDVLLEGAESGRVERSRKNRED